MLMRSYTHDTTTFANEPVVSMNGGIWHSMVITADGALWASGSGRFGQ